MSALQKKSWIAIVVGVGALAVVCLLAIRAWRRQRAEAQAIGPGADLIAAARVRMTKLDRSIEVHPWGLVARVDARWKCKPSREGLTCEHAAGWTLRWNIEAESNPDTIDGIIHGAHNDSTIANVDIGGFKGAIDLNVSTRMPVTDITFVGFRDDPNIGRSKLRMYANVWRRAGANDILETDPIAVMLSTALGPRGMPPQIPTSSDARAYFEAAEGFAHLTDDGASAEWFHAAQDVAEAKVHHAIVLDAFLASQPNASDLVMRRLREQKPDPAGFTLATSLAAMLHDFDAPSAEKAEADLAAAMRASWTIDRADAPTWIGLEARLASQRSREQDHAPIVEVATYLTPIDRAIVLKSPRAPLTAMRRFTKLPEVAHVYEAWLDPSHVPASANLEELAAFAENQPGDKVVRRHLIAMLANRSANGTLEARDKDYVMHGAVDAPRFATGLPPAGTTVDIRTCDWYGVAMSSASSPFTPWIAPRLRDEQLAAMITNLKSLE